MLGHPVMMTLPRVVGCKLVGKPGDFVTSTDLVLAITKVNAMNSMYCICIDICPVYWLASYSAFCNLRVFLLDSCCVSHRWAVTRGWSSMARECSMCQWLTGRPLQACVQTMVRDAPTSPSTITRWTVLGTWVSVSVRVRARACVCVH